MIICLIGIDGSGKTMQAKLLLDALHKKRNPSKYFHSFSRKTFADRVGLRLFINLFIKKLDRTTGNRLVVGINVAIRLASILVDSWLTHCFRTVKFKKTVLIYDRYYYDSLVILASIHKDLENQIIAFARLVPKPDVVILFEIAPEVSVIRKQEHTISEAARLVQLYKKLIQVVPMKTVDAESDAAGIRLQVDAIVQSNR
jgi:thymidylate kinase